MKKYQTEINAIRILALIQQYGGADGPIKWTLDRFSQTLCLELGEVDAAVQWLRKRDYLVYSRGEYLITRDGRHYYESARRHPDFVHDIQQWKTEALTGLKEKMSKKSGYVVSIESRMDRVAMPRNAILGHPDPESVLIEMIDRKYKGRKKK